MVAVPNLRPVLVLSLLNTAIQITNTSESTGTGPPSQLVY
jgi:hypothetical protein